MLTQICRQLCHVVASKFCYAGLHRDNLSVGKEHDGIKYDDPAPLYMYVRTGEPPQTVWPVSNIINSFCFCTLGCMLVYWSIKVFEEQRARVYKYTGWEFQIRHWCCLHQRDKAGWLMHNMVYSLQKTHNWLLMLQIINTEDEPR